MSEYHTPVMLDESVSALVTNPDGVYADATFGGGGHTAELLSRLHDGARVIALEAVATLPNFFHAYTMARASSPSIVTGMPSGTPRTIRA